MSFASKLAAERPEEVALRDEARALTWAEVGDTLDRCAKQLLAASLGPRRRIAVFAENSAETLLAHLGATLGGASAVPVNFHLNVDETTYILKDSETQLLFVGPENAETGLAAARKAGVPKVVGWRCPTSLPSDRTAPALAAPELTDWAAWLAEAEAGPAPEDHPPLPNLMYTSGTTGVPKGTELPPTMFAGGETITEHLERLRENTFCEFGTHLVVGPLYHTGPLGGVRILGGGVPVLVLGKFDAGKTLRAIERYRPESVVMVPTHFIRLLALPEASRARYDVSSLKLVYHTGATCPVDVKRAMLDWWGPVIYEAYGATEVGTTCRIGPEDWLAHPGSVGRPNPPFEVLVVDEQDRELPPGQSGRLYFRDSTGRGVVYPGDPEKSEAAHLRPGVFTLGEIGHVDEEGFVYITDRFSDMIVSGGVNVYPAEAEQALCRHAEVRDAVCIGVPHPDMGEALLAIVQAREPESPPEAEALIAFCRSQLSAYKCPRRVEFRADLGRNAMGKINKPQLRAPYWAAPGAS